MSDFDVLVGDCREVMKGLEPDSVDSVVTDPPYELGFMGKKWDNSGVAYDVELWREALRVAKPGAFLLAFGGSRTSHRLTCAIEDAGWEIRDCIMWLYGSGFPKSHDVSKAIDKAAGAKREAVRVPSAECRNPKAHGGGRDGQEGATRPWIEAAQRNGYHEKAGDTPATDAARKWNGWGTALKPAHEDIVIAQKPLDITGVCATLVQKLMEALCQLSSTASVADESLALSQNVPGGGADSAQWSVGARCNTRADLLGLMDTLPSGSELHSSLNIGLSWLDTLVEVCNLGSTFTTETRTSLTTDLRTLNSLPLAITPSIITEAATGQGGTGLSASPAAATFSAVASKLNCIRTLSAAGLATSKDESSGLRPNYEPIVVARKPLVGTVAANFERHGCGGLNIDGCRVKTGEVTGWGGNGSNGFSGGLDSSGPARPVVGRWPANVVHDGSDEATAGMGSAARFFYCAKASKRDRDEGCEGMGLVETPYRQVNSEWKADDRHPDGGYATAPQPKARNHHPTVKPTDLMRYLVRLVTPPNGLVLDPFTGSGSTGKACALEGFRFLGIEQSEEYAGIAKARIAACECFASLDERS